ncbi:MAG: hypothetical protein KatS3mg001_607 [Candidatus Pacearchaeota archaeon]|nr:MAG: hypothetical protein KatS3mg001_607 [Candidatus Pacearchaeota archaeon]
MDHERVVRKIKRIGKLVGLDYEEAINIILNLPTLASYSIKRYVAALDVGRQLKKECFDQNREMLKEWLKCYQKSPYVPFHDRMRISKVKNGELPPILIEMRKKIDQKKA